MARKTGGKYRKLIISWLKEDLEYYKANKGGVTEFWTLINQKLINSTEARIRELENKD